MALILNLLCRFIILIDSMISKKTIHLLSLLLSLIQNHHLIHLLSHHLSHHLQVKNFNKSLSYFLNFANLYHLLKILVEFLNQIIT